MKELARGAEAVLYVSGKFLIKDRIKKDYRIDEIDRRLRSTRTRGEYKLLEKSSKLIKVPGVVSCDKEKITMEHVDGKLMRDILDGMSKAVRAKLCKEIGVNIKKLHNSNIMHGDLTTSNMILKNDELYFIDFGLGFISDRQEDKAVDMHLLKQALFSKHYNIAEECFLEIMGGYEPSKEFLERFDKVEGRGRYKSKKG